MELIRGLHNLRPHHRGCAVTMGAFDGLHRGHHAVLKRLLDKSRELNLPSMVVVFEPLPREFFMADTVPARLMSFRERYRALSGMGVDRLLCINFNRNFANITAQEFVDQVVLAGLGVRFLMVGDDVHFGRDQQGDFKLLQKVGKAHGFDVEKTATLLIGNQRVSSSRIRKALEEADFELAEELLGRPYSIAGKVIAGDRRGGTLGAPTANLNLRRRQTAMSGVYVVEVLGLDHQVLRGVANLGTRPTIGDGLKANLEVHLLNYNQDIYGKYIEVVFQKKLRDEVKFTSLDELRQAIRKDIDETRTYFGC